MIQPTVGDEPATGRRELVLSALSVFAVAVTIALWARTFLTFPRPEDVAYYVSVARSVVEGRGFTSDAIWSYGTPPLSFPRPAFEVWLPMATVLAAIPMALLGTTFAAAQLSSVVVGGVAAVLVWRLGADVAADLGLPRGRARALALGSGLTAAVYLPLVLVSAEPDSTAPFAALSLAACLVMGRLLNEGRAGGPRRAAMSGEAATVKSGPSVAVLAGLGVLLGLAALTRNEAVWLGLTWAAIAWRLVGFGRDWLRLVGIPALVAAALFVPWAIRDWAEFGTPLPGQALSNALMIKGSDIFAWSDPPTLGRYLNVGFGTLLALHWEGFIHNLVNVLVLLGFPVSVIGLVGLPAAVGRSVRLRPLALFALITFAVTTLVFPVATTAGTFLHAAGAIHALLIVAALVALDSVIAAAGRRRAWTRPVAWLGPLFAAGAAMLLTVSLLPSQGEDSRTTEAAYAALPGRLAAAGYPLPSDGRPVITDHPIWFAWATGHRAIALPDELPASVLDLAARFGGAPLLIIEAKSLGIWPEILESGGPDADCFVPVPLGNPPDRPRNPADIIVFQITCP
jgi:hypothetical protein